MYLHNADGVGESRALLPASHYDHGVALLDELATLSVFDAELHTGIHVLQPVLQRRLCN